MTEYDLAAVIENECFAQMRGDANRVLQKLLNNMVEKSTNEGSVTIKIDITLQPEFIPIPIEGRTDDSPEVRKVLRPEFEHKISSTMQIKGEAKGKYSTDMMELVYDSNTDQYILTPVKGGQQVSIFDVMEDDHEESADDESMENMDADDLDKAMQEHIEGAWLLGVPGPVQEATENEPEAAMNAPEIDDVDDNVIDAEYREIDTDGSSDVTDIPAEDVEDMTGEFLSEEYYLDDYDYDDPEEE